MWVCRRSVGPSGENPSTESSCFPIPKRESEEYCLSVPTRVIVRDVPRLLFGTGQPKFAEGQRVSWCLTYRNLSGSNLASDKSVKTRGASQAAAGTAWSGISFETDLSCKLTCYDQTKTVWSMIRTPSHARSFFCFFGGGGSSGWLAGGALASATDRGCTITPDAMDPAISPAKNNDAASGRSSQRHRSVWKPSLRLWLH